MLRDQLLAALLKAAQQVVERFVALQRAQVLRVGAGDVDGDVVGVWVDAGQADQVVIDRVLDRRDGVLADVQAQDAAVAAKARLLDVGQEAVEAFVVEAQAVDQRARLGQAEHARLWVARLGLGRDGAHLDEAKAHGAQAIDHAPVLVQASGHAHAVGEGDASQRHWVLHAAFGPQAGQRCVLQAGQRTDGQVVRGFRVQVEEDRFGNEVGDQGHGGRQVSTNLDCRRSGLPGRGLPLWQTARLFDLPAPLAPERGQDPDATGGRTERSSCPNQSGSRPAGRRRHRALHRPLPQGSHRRARRHPTA